MTWGVRFRFMNARLNNLDGSANRKSDLTNECTHQTRVSQLDRSRFSAFGWRFPDRHRRVCSGKALTSLLLLVSLTAVFAAGLLFAQSPPTPQAVELRPVKVAWDPQPASEYYNAVDTNGNFVGITYRVYNATNVTGPWSVVATTTNLSVTISNLTARTQFFHVTASNCFLESEASRILSIPQDKVPPPRLLIGE